MKAWINEEEKYPVFTLVDEYDDYLRNHCVDIDVRQAQWVRRVQGEYYQVQDFLKGLYRRGAK